MDANCDGRRGEAPPNIVLIVADQLAAAFVGCYGSGVDSTPTLDRLAARGVRFDRAYAHAAVCAPNRATFLTGRSSEIHGVVTNNLYLPRVHPTFAHVLQRAGYRAGAFGKFHQTSMLDPLPPDFGYLGFDESVPTEDPKLGPWLDWVRREHPEYSEQALAVTWPMPYASHYGPDGEDLTEPMRRAREKHLSPAQAAGPSWGSYRSPLPPELHQTTWITDLSLDFVRRHPPEQPFFLMASYVDPHDPYDPPAPYDTMFNADEMPAPLPMPEGGYPCGVLEKARRIAGFDKVAGDEQQLRALRAMYHGSIRFIDDQVSRILDLLDQQGRLDNTIIVFTTDHGDMMGDHGFIAKNMMHYDKSIRCPLIVAGPGVRQGESDRLTSSLDLFPTLCDWAGATQRPPVEGKSLAPTCADASAEDGWDAVTVQSTAEGDGTLVRSIVTDDRWRLTVCCEPDCGQMFDLAADPEERRNLYQDPAWTAKRLELHERLTRAYMRPLCTHAYPNLPVRAGRRYGLREGQIDLAPICDDLLK